MKPQYTWRGWLVWFLTLLVAASLTLYFILTIRLANLLLSVTPVSVPQGDSLVDALADWGLPPPQRFTLVSDGAHLAGWHFENPAGGECGVVMLHGRGGTRFHILEHAPLFWSLGCDLVSVDARQHGESQGGYGTYGAREAGDTLAVVGWLAARRGLSRAQIGLFGVSYGATTALMAAAEAPDLAFVVADSAFADLPTIAYERGAQAFGAPLARLFLPASLWLAGQRADFDPWAISAEAAVRGNAPPVLLIHARADGVTHAGHSERIFAACNPGRCVLQITDWGAPHAVSYTFNPAAYRALLADFLAEHAPGFGGP